MLFYTSTSRLFVPPCETRQLPLGDPKKSDTAYALHGTRISAAWFSLLRMEPVIRLVSLPPAIYQVSDSSPLFVIIALDTTPTLLSTAKMRM